MSLNSWLSKKNGKLMDKFDGDESKS
jgi:hypothetical protein